jgi:hypothetical protein
MPENSPPSVTIQVWIRKWSKLKLKLL